MEEVKNFLDLFTDETVKSQISEIVQLTEQIAKKQPVYGFHYKFYVPGWIGFIQQCIVENKMSKFASEKFINDKSYYEFADWIINHSKEVADALVKTVGETESNNEAYKLQTNGVIHAFNVITEAWASYAPEVATFCNLKYTEDTLISPVGMVYKGLQHNLKEIGYPATSESPRKETSFKDDAKNGLYAIAGYILNIILFAIIAGLLGTIFG